MLNPVIMLFSQYRTEETDNRVAVRENTYDIGTPTGLPIKSLGRVIRLDFGPH